MGECCHNTDIYRRVYNWIFMDNDDLINQIYYELDQNAQVMLQVQLKLLLLLAATEYERGDLI